MRIFRFDQSISAYKPCEHPTKWGTRTVIGISAGSLILQLSDPVIARLEKEDSGDDFSCVGTVTIVMTERGVVRMLRAAGDSDVRERQIV